VAGANAAAIIGVDALAGQGVFELATFRDMLWGLGNGMGSAVLTIGLLPFLESFFGVLTAVNLLELANPNRPLLHKLLMEAPGTYHHSIIVGNLAEAAAVEIGGNTALVRVGALYHDIGKTKRPYFFIDNQFGGENPHDKISPSLSALIITSHVRDGVAMAQEAGLPQEVVDLIHQHHGNSLVSYFYTRATENGGAEQVIEDDFRYDCPRPQTREAAILMLADSCEAAVRSLTKAPPGRIEAVVRKIIKDRLDDGQLEQSPLTFKDLDRIATVFTKILAGTFHKRIEYPDSLELRGRPARNGKPVNGKNGTKARGGEANGCRAKKAL
jgi:putative nucleotidyltransferase with HDIG domain